MVNGKIIYKPKRKTEVFIESFFPPPIQADLSDISESIYPRPYNIDSITKNEIARAVFKLSSKKAPRLDDIPNLVLQRTADIILPIYEKLFNRCLETRYYSQYFRTSIIVAFRKPGKEDYTSPKTWRPIALLNTVDKVMQGVIATRMSYLAEENKLLPNTHMGGRK